MKIKVSLNESIRETRPYTCMYTEKYGRKLEGTMWEIDFPNINTAALPTKYKGKIELLFKECIETGKTLEEVRPSAPDGVIL